MTDIDWKAKYEELMVKFLQQGFDHRQTVRALEADARRYQWMKANARDAGMWDDASIDAAMEQKT